MGKVQKRTKKFIKNSLPRSLKVRRLKQKFSRKDAAKQEKKSRGEKKSEQGDEEEESTSKTKKKIEELDVDSFMEGGFFGGDEGDSEDDGALDAAIGEDDEGSDVGDMDEVSFHRMQLEALAKNDPEFYQHLKENDKSLLDFKEDDEDEQGDATTDQKQPKKKEAKQKAKLKSGAETKESSKLKETKDDDEDDDEDEPEPAPAKKKARDEEKPTLTMEKLKQIQHELSSHSRSALKQLIRVFRAAAHISDDAKQGEADAEPEISFASPKVFNTVVRMAFQSIPAEFSYYLGGSTGSVKTHPKFAALEPLIRSYLGNLVHFVSKVLDVTMIRLVLSHMEGMVVYFVAFPKLALRFLKGLLSFWATSEEDVRIDAFLRIRQLVLAMPPKSTILEDALKGTYLTFVRNTGFVSIQSMPTIIFMANCVVELYGLEPVSSYQHTFVYIRQLAIHLRNAIHAKTKESFKGICNWKFVNCLRVWAMVLAAHGAKSASYLEPLVYPFVQVCVGVLDLLSASRYFPLRFNVIRILIKLTETTKTYIPLSAYLMDTIQTALAARKPKKSSASPPNFLYLVKVTKTTALTKGYQSAVVTEALSLLQKHLTVYSYSAAFPELSIPIEIFLKKQKKQCPIPRFAKQISQFLLKLEANSKFISEKRSHIDFTPQMMVKTDGPEFKQLIQQKDKNCTSPLERYAALSSQEPSESEGRLMSSKEMQAGGPKKRRHGGESESEEEEDEEEDGNDEPDDEGDEEDEEEKEEKEVVPTKMAVDVRANAAKLLKRTANIPDRVEEFAVGL